jgi:hypothetical protein
MEAVDFCVATSAVTDSVTASPVEQAKSKLTTKVKMARREHRRDPEVQREGNDVTQAAFQSPTAHAVRTHGKRRLVYVTSVTGRWFATHPPCPAERRRWHRCRRCRESSDPRHRNRNRPRRRDNREPSDP